MKIKTESSGYPEDCKSDSEKEAFVKRAFEMEGLVLDPSRIEKNASLRYLAKLCLNSFWVSYFLDFYPHSH